MSLQIGISVSSDVTRWTIVDISFVWHVVILVLSDNFSKFPRALWCHLTNFLWSESYAGIARSVSFLGHYDVI